MLLSSMAIRSLLLQASVLSYSLAAGAFHSNPPSFVNEPEGLMRLAIPVAAGMLGVIVLDRSSLRGGRSPNSLAIDLMAIYGLIVLSQLLLTVVKPELGLPNWAPTQGGFVGFMLFAATRAIFGGPVPNDVITGAVAGDRLRMLYRMAASVAIVVSIAVLFATSLRGQVAAAVVALGSLYFLQRTFSPHAEILQSAATWHYISLFPASLIALFGSKVYLYWIPILILIFAEANQRRSSRPNGLISSLP